MRFLYLFFVFVNSEKIIKNVNVKSCINCIYYKSIYDDYTFSKCKKFGEKNIISNEINYYYAESCRNDELKCGKEGKYFEEDKFLKKILITISVMLLVFSVANVVQN